MNKKLALGFTAAVAAGAFWACGSGDIIKSNDDDGLAVFVTDSWNGYNVDSAMIYCSMDATCAAEMAAAGPMNPVGETSSESTPGPGPAESASSAYVPPMSSGPFPPFGQSSSSSFKFVTLSSSSSAIIPSTPVETSSSSSVIIIPTGGDSDYGTCAPVPSVIELGGSVTWKFTKGPAVTNPIAITTADYAWTFEGGSIPSSAKHGNASSDAVSYNTSGVKNASLVFTMSAGTSVPIKCSPLQVNGAPITGCKCAAEALSVDYTSAAPSWSVSGCATATATKLLTYSWDGGAAGAEATFSKPFTEAQSGWAPVLKVANDDNTIIDVTCPAVKTTKGAEYQFLKSDTKVALPAGESSVLMDLPAEWHNGTAGTCTFRCDGANQPITITIGTTTSKPDYSATIALPITQTINKTSLVVNLDVAANCQVSY